MESWCNISQIDFTIVFRVITTYKWYTMIVICFLANRQQTVSISENNIRIEKVWISAIILYYFRFGLMNTRRRTCVTTCLCDDDRVYHSLYIPINNNIVHMNLISEQSYDYYLNEKFEIVSFVHKMRNEYKSIISCLLRLEATYVHLPTYLYIIYICM